MLSYLDYFLAIASGFSILGAFLAFWAMVKADQAATAALQAAGVAVARVRGVWVARAMGDAKRAAEDVVDAIDGQDALKAAARSDSLAVVLTDVVTMDMPPGVEQEDVESVESDAWRLHFEIAKLARRGRPITAALRGDACAIRQAVTEIESAAQRAAEEGPRDGR